MIVAGIGTDEAVNDGCNFGQAKDFANGFIGPAVAKGCAHGCAVFELACAHFFVRYFTEFARYEVVKSQEAGTGKFGHFDGCKQKVLIH